MTEWSETNVKLPGATISSRWRRTALPDGLWWIEEDVRCRGRMKGPYAMGPGWIIEFIEMKTGSIAFRQGERQIPVPWRRFVFVLPAFSVVHMDSRDAIFHFVAIAGESRFGTLAPSRQLKESQIFPLRTKLPTNGMDLLERLDSLDHGVSVEISTSFSPLVCQARSWLAENYRERVSIAELAKILHVSHPHLSREFRRALGMSPLRYLHYLRSGEAMSRIAKGEPILDTSLDVGYSDLSRFYKQFRRLGCDAPGRYRQIKKRQDTSSTRA
ncbi:MAG: helix-turn-helix transcriptional regulator [Acidobacteria bacterium]|nr:helix-turn-helix transcriptional regulator [Acidobacteriota bacterium]